MKPAKPKGSAPTPPWLNDRPAPDGQPVRANFERWFAQSKVVDPVNPKTPLRLFHGTTNVIETFDRSRLNIESDVGAGFYCTNDPDDASTNYANLNGADLVAKIEHLAEFIFQNQDEIDLGNEGDPYAMMERAKEIARERSCNGVPNILPVYLSLQNPVVFGGKDETQFEYDYIYDEMTDEYGAEQGTLLELIVALRWVVFKGNYDEVDVDRVIQEVRECVDPGDSIGVDKLYGLMKGSEGLCYARDLDNDKAATGEILRRAFERMGFDGVIDHTVNAKFGSELRRLGKPMAGMDEHTVHYVAFRANQVKSAVGNSGLYADGPDPSDAVEGYALDARMQKAMNQASRARAVVKKEAPKSKVAP